MLQTRWRERSVHAILQQSITRLAFWSCDIHAPFSTVKYKGGTLGAVKHKVKDMVNSVVEAVPTS